MPGKTPPDVSIVEWATDDNYADPGKPWDATPTKVDPGSLATSGYKPEDEPTAQEWNYVRNALTKRLSYYEDLQFVNWKYDDVSGLGAVNELEAGAWIPDDAGGGAGGSLAGFLVLCGDDTLIRAANFHSWTFSTAGGVNYRAAFYTPNAGNGEVCILAGNTDVATVAFTGITINTETAADIWWNGEHDTSSGNDIIAGFLAGGDFGFLYGTTTGVSDLNRSADTFPVPDLGGGVAVARASVFAAAQQNMWVRHDPATGRILCLVCYHGTTVGSAGGRVDQFVSTNGGVNWTETQDVIAGIEDVTGTGLRGLAWDATRNLWLATADQKLFSAPAAGSSSWTEVADSSDIWGATGQASGRVIVVGNTWVLSQAGSNNALAWSRDGGGTWTRYRPGARGEVLIYAGDRLVHGSENAIGFPSTEQVASGIGVGLIPL